MAALLQEQPSSQLLCVDRQPGSLFPNTPAVLHINADLSHKDEVAALVASHRPTQIIHLAAASAGAGTDRDYIFAINVEGTRAVLDAAADLKPFPRVVFVSTGYVYGDREGTGPALETSPLGPLWRFGAYTDSKIEAENCARNYPAFTTIARPFTHIGPGQASTFAVSSFARQIAQIEAGKLPPTIKVGNLAARRDILDVRDVVKAYTLLLSRGRPGEAYNIASNHPHSTQFLLQSLVAMSTVPVSIEVDPARLRPADIQCSTGDAAKILTETGWRPQIPLEQTLADTLNHWRQFEGAA